MRILVLGLEGELPRLTVSCIGECCMSDYILISKASESCDKTVTLKGWISNLRSSGKISFIELRDGSGFIQVVAAKNDLDEASIAVAGELTLESAISVTGVIVKHPKKEGVYEMQATSLELIHKTDNYPIGRKEHGPDFLLQHRHLWLRSKKQWAIQRIRDTAVYAIITFLKENAFTRIDSPIITSTACEDTTSLFEFEYFDVGTGYLSQSGQMYLEAALAAHGRVYDFGPVFRAEKSKTRKHLTEFWMMDAEMAFFEHEQNMQIQEQLVMYVIDQVLTQNAEELEILERDTSKLSGIKAPFIRKTHSEIVAILRERGSEITEETDLGAKDEEILSEIFDQPIFIDRWPAKIKAFYMKRCPDNPTFSLASDLMATEGYGELIGGSERECDADVLLKYMGENKVPVEDFEWYLDARRYGSVPHSGFGIGLERLVSWLSGIDHIRETIPFPRTIYRYTP